MEKIGRYQILKRLGEGGFGAVYLAHDDRVDRDVAIKLFRPREENLIAFATSSSEDGLQVLRQRFIREARILGRLSDSPYIINVYEFGETEEGSPYYVMPYVESHLGQLLGRDVFDRAALDELDQSAHPKALPLEQCLTLLHQILQGMKAAHAHGLVHRDIKPSNILLSDVGAVRIADFGIAKDPDGSQTTLSQLGMGSRNYMAPEQRESAKHVDGRADVYSLGVLVYRMLTGKLPTGRYADPEVVVPQLGEALNGMILKALEEDKDKRFRDAGEMLATCEAALQQRAQEDKAGTYTGTFTDLSSDSPVSGVPEKLRPLYALIDHTLLHYGDVGPRLSQLQGMAAVVGLDNKALQSVIRDRIRDDEDLQGIVNLHRLIQKETAASTDSVKDLVTKLLPAAELAGKDRAWLEARLSAAVMRATGQDGSRSSLQAASHRTSKHVADSSDAGSGKWSVLSAAVSVVAVVAVSVVGLWFWLGVSDDISQYLPRGTGDREDATAPRPEPGGTFRDLLAGGGEGPLMVVLPAGRFRMGCLSDDSDCNGSEKPVHEVTLPKGFAMGVYEVTFDEYDRYVQATGARRPDDEGWGRGNRPVINVDWEEARAYVRWLSEQTGHRYRLPTEPEWEYAARAGTTTKYSWGSAASREQTNYGTDECCEGLAQGSDRWINTAPVGSFPANGFGLNDMHGNVWEWTQDCWHDIYRGAPPNGQAWEGANGGDCDRRVVRGGSWFVTLWAQRAAYRYYFDVSLRFNDLGFRLVQDLP